MKMSWDWEEGCFGVLAVLGLITCFLLLWMMLSGDKITSRDIARDIAMKELWKTKPPLDKDLVEKGLILVLIILGLSFCFLVFEIVASWRYRRNYRSKYWEDWKKYWKRDILSSAWGFSLIVFFVLGTYLTAISLPTWRSTGGGERSVDGYYYKIHPGSGNRVIVGPTHHPTTFERIAYGSFVGLVCVLLGMLLWMIIFKILKLNIDEYMS